MIADGVYWGTRNMAGVIKSVQLMGVVMLLAASPNAADKVITVGMFPDGLTQEERAPISEYLSKAMGRPVSLEIPDRYRDTVARLAEGTYDFAWLGGVSYVRAHASDGVIPLVQRTSDREFHAIFITGAGSSIYSLKDLKGKQFAFGDVYSTSGHVMPDRELRQAGVNPDTDLKVRYTGSHPLTGTLVETGVVDAGAMDEEIFRSMVRTRKLDAGKIRIFHTTGPFVDWVYVARRDVPAAEREKFSAALLTLKTGKDDALLKLLGATKFVKANDEEYFELRRIVTELGLLEAGAKALASTQPR
jgi:phosphonate transport system substrate-binding protein